MNADHLVDLLREQDVLADDRVAGAFAAVPRHLFLPSVPLQTVYTDEAVYTLTDDRGGFIGGSDQPSQMAKMLSLAGLQPGHNVLEIGTGTGYNAALVQHLVGDDGRVTSVEIDRTVYEHALDNMQRATSGHVNVVNSDGAAGYAQRASYDRIISTVALWDIPPTWVRQLRPGGRIVAPLYLDGVQVCAALTVTPDDVLASDNNVTCAYVPIRGIAAPPIQHLYLGGGSALRLYSNNAAALDSARLHMLLQSDAENCHLGAALGNRDYWDGLAPYLMLNVPEDYEFVTYAVEGDKMVYGLRGRGFGLVRSSTAAFVCADELGNTHCFAGVDAFLAVDASYRDWLAGGELRVDRLRVRLLPHQAQVPPPPRGRQFTRTDHTLHAWLAPVETGSTDG